MTSRDAQASYYDLELPDGTHTEVWSVLRAALTPEEALGYVKAAIITRIMRDGKKLDVDRMREAAKVAVEAGMLREAMEAYLATPDPMTAALDAVDSHDPRECEERTEAMDRMVTFARHDRDEAQRMAREFQEAMRAEAKRAREFAARIAELERELEQSEARADARLRNMESARDRIAELERERNEAHQALRETSEEIDRARNLHGAMDAESLDEFIMRLVTERNDARMDYVQAHRERDEYRRLYEAEAAAGEALSETHTRATADYIAVTDEADAERDRWRQTAERAQADLDALRKTLETEREDHVVRAVELERMRKAVQWALGEAGAFRLRGEKEGAYWWRSELRRRAFCPPPAPEGE